MPAKKGAKAKAKAEELSTEGSDGDTSSELVGVELRGKSFVGAYGRKKDKKLMARLPTMLSGRETSTLIPRADTTASDKLLLVFDLDETIVYARDGPLILRPHAKKLLQELGKVTELALWTAGVRDYAKAVLAELEREVWGKSPAGVIKHLISRNKTWFDEEDYTKDLRKLGRPLDTVLIVENTPDCVRLNPKNAIIVEDFEGGRDSAHTLTALTNVIKDLIASGLPVPEFIPKCPELERQVIDDAPVYYLVAGRKGATKQVKENKDKKPKTAAKKKPGKDKEEDEEESDSGSGSETSEDDRQKKQPKKPAKKAGSKQSKKRKAETESEGSGSDTEEEEAKPKAKKPKAKPAKKPRK